MKRNTLTTAVLAGLTGVAGMAGVANAVNVNPDGLGQVLLFPYYSARGGNTTLVSIVNTTERGKAVKIRFIEALNSREVLDFNIYMSPFDVWTAAVTGTDAGGAKMITTDTTCTVPYIFGNGGEQAFLNFEFTGARADGGPTGIERTASGYIEVIEMGTLLAVPEKAPKLSDPEIVAWVTKHVAGVPRNCVPHTQAWTNYQGGTSPLPWSWLTNSEFGFDTDQGASGGLFGAASIINVAEGTMFSYNATAIDGFFAAGDMDHVNPGDLEPDLASGTNAFSNVFVNGDVVSHNWGGLPANQLPTLQAVNAVLTQRQIFNEYVTDAEIGARTEWVMTFPTKRFHTDFGPTSTAAAIPPFTKTWTNPAAGVSPSCEAFSFTTPRTDEEYYATNGSRAFDREEGPGVTPDDPATPVPPVVSPRPPQTTPEVPPPDLFNLCREANVIRFSQIGEAVPTVSEILKEPARAAGLGFSNFALPFDAGWVRFDLGQIGVTTNIRRTLIGVNTDGGAQQRLEGLPVIGFAVTTYTNGQLAGGTLANYGGTFNHRGSRSVVSS